jgi:hypothetical protein
MLVAALTLGLTTSFAAAPVCTSWGSPTLLATCDDCPRIDESSGVVPARNRAGVWFTHNDAGGSAELYAFDTTGTHIDTHPVVGGGFRDWEDIASGPCPDGIDAHPCLYIADVGDNSESREEVDIWVVAEPASGESATVVASWRLRYPVDPHDCEALVVHPCTGRVYLLTKERDGDPVVFEVPEEPTGLDAATDLKLVGTLPRTWFDGSGLITGADWSEGGDQLVVRTYDGGWVWQTDPTDPAGHWTVPPDPIPIDVEGQGESIAFHPDGGVLTTTERAPMRIVHLPCDATTDPSECPPPEAEDTGEPVDSGEPVDTACCEETGVETDSGDSESPVDSAPSDSGSPALVSDSASADKSTCGCGGGAGAWVVVWGMVGWRRRSGRVSR